MLDNYRDLIDELLETPALLRTRASSEDPDEQLPALIAVLRDRDRTMLSRVQGMTQKAEPHLRALVDAESVITSPPAVTEPLETLLAESDIARGDLVSLLMNLTLKDWEKQATHDLGGYVTLADEVESHVEFDELLRQRLGLPQHP